MKTIQNMKGHSKLLLCGLLIVAILIVCGFAWSPKKITLIADGKQQVINTNSIRAKSVVKEAGIKLNEYDVVKTNTNRLTDGSIITVVRAFPVQVDVQGEVKQVYTTQKTADDLAKELHYSRPKYVVVGDLNQELKIGSMVKIAKVTNVKTHKTEKQIEPETVQEPDSTMPRGLSHIASEGKAGLADVTEEIYYVGDKAVQTVTVSQNVKEQMVPRVLKVGTRNSMIEPSRGIMRYTKKLTLEATAYTVAEGNGDGLTATGLVATRGMVAVDPNVIPLGTRLYIPGYGVALAADTGGAIQGNRIDLLMDEYHEAIEFGRRPLDVYILQ